MDHDQVLVLDADGRVLLLRTPAGADHVWSTPDVRQVREDLGLLIAADGFARYDTAAGHVLVCHRPRWGVSAAGLTDTEREHHLGHRWWSVSDLRYTSETVRPAGLAGLLEDVLADPA